jgi:hypothetical protein
MKRVLLVSLAACSLGATPAAAAERARAGPLAAGPVFAAGEATWAVREPSDGFTLRALRGGRTRVLSARSRTSPRTWLQPGLAGGAVAFLDVTEFDGDVRPTDSPAIRSTERLLVAGDGTAESLERCEPGVPPEVLPGDGDAEATVRVACGRDLVVREAATGREVTLPSRGRTPRIAGRYVAFVAAAPLDDRGDIVVYDWRESRELYRVPTARLREPIRRLDVRDDGAVAFEHSFAGGIAWSSPSRPGITRLRLPRREQYQVRWHGRAILFAAGEEQGAVLPRAELGLATLRGTRRILARRVRVVNEGFDTDGRRITYVARACGGLRVIVRRVDERPRGC